jgi:TetR/AcrR family transcriptional repressor of nem operon
MSKRDQKKEAILLAGMEVMRGKGYNGTSVKDIVDAAGVPKGSFYNYFDSKEGFALDAVDYAADQGRQAAEAIFSDTSLKPIARIQYYFESCMAHACNAKFKQGCFIGNMCQEMADNSEVMRAMINRKLKVLTLLIADAISEAKAQGDLTRPLEPKQTAEFLFNAWEGAIMRAKASQCREPMDAFLAMLKVIF